VIVTVCPWSTVCVAGFGAGTTSSVFTVTVTELEVDGVPVVSVTCSSNAQTPVVDRTPVEVLGVLVVLQPDVNDEPRLT
jgi:L-asparaginase/Glu-tRNA(Gln) amidotransferase subunit D